MKLNFKKLNTTTILFAILIVFTIIYCFKTIREKYSEDTPEDENIVIDEDVKKMVSERDITQEDLDELLAELNKT